MNRSFLFLFYKKSGLVDNLIKWVTKGKYSHCALIFPDRLHTLELSWKNSTEIKHFYYPKNSYDMYKLNIHLSDQEINKINKFIFNRISRGYDWKYIISRALNLLFGTKIVNSKRRYNCDEIIVEAFKKIHIELVDSNTPLSPDSLAQSKYFTKL